MTLDDHHAATTHRPGIARPLILLCLFGVVAPVRLPGYASGPASHECLTLADTPGRSGALLSRMERCSVLYPDDVELLADIGAAYERTDAARAERLYARALEIDPDYADVRLKLGRLLLRRGARDEAIEQAHNALRVQPNRQALLDLLSEAASPEGVRD